MSTAVTRTLITLDLEGLADAARSVPGAEVVTAFDRASILKQIDQAEVLCVARNFDAELLKAAKNVRWVHAMLGGVEAILFPEFVESPVPLTCVKECFGMPGAQHAMASMVAVVSRLNDYWWLRSKRKLEWRLPRELQGKTLGIIGFGNIGRTLAELARPFGMRTIALARSARPDSGPANELLTPDQLPRLLGESDFVVLTVPLTHATRGMIDEPQIRQMKPSAWFIDISGRPAIINEAAIIRALQQGRLGGADLQFASPPPADSPLWEMENLIISMYSANSEEEGQRSNELFAENLRRYRQKQPLLGVVDKKAGY